MAWIEDHPFKMAVIVSLIISGFAILFYNANYNPKDWAVLFMWLPLYTSPAWIISSISYLTEGRNN